MNEKDCQILKVLSEELNITRAARRLYISQPALSYRIKQIEDQFNTSIITRSQKGIQFTTEGEHVLEYAINMLSQLKKTKDLIDNTSKNIGGTIRLGVSSNYAHYKLPSNLQKFLKLYPNVQINVTTGWSSDVTELLRKEEVQIAIIRGNHLWDQKKTLLYKESLSIISKNGVDLHELPNLPRIDYKTDHSLDTSLKNWWYSNYNKPANITMTVDKIETCKEMVKHGLGYAIVPEMCLQENDNLAVKKISKKRKTWLLYSDSLLKLKLVKAFVKFMKENT